MVFLLKRHNHSVFGIGESKAADNSVCPRTNENSLWQLYLFCGLFLFYFCCCCFFFTSSSAINIVSSVVT